jgi:hypothetical protein
VAQQPAEPLSTFNWPALRRVRGVTIDEFVVQALVISLAVIVLGIRLDDSTRVALAQRNHLRETFRLDRALTDISIGSGPS